MSPQKGNIQERGAIPSERRLADVVQLGSAVRRRSGRPYPTKTTMTPVGGYLWRKARGLLTLGDLAGIYRAQRFLRPGYVIPLPEDRVPAWRLVP